MEKLDVSGKVKVQAEVVNPYKSKINLIELKKEIDRLEFWADGSGAEMSITQSGGMPEWLSKSPVILSAIDEITALRKQKPLHLMINRVSPGVVLPNHRDFLKPTSQGEFPCLERWHLPVITNSKCTWWDADSGEKHLLPGIWVGPMPYWILHNVKNLGTSERVHLIVDFDTPTRIGAYKD